MLLISHRGNLRGKNKKLENNPQHLLEVIERFNVEVDVWYKNNQWLLGHDEPQYIVDYDFFKFGMWLHCKNLEAVQALYNSKLNWFWHENDAITLTSHRHIWCSPKIYVPSGITVEFDYNQSVPNYVLGICTDCPEMYL